MRIIHIPLDERPCNYDFVYKIFNNHENEIIKFDKSILGLKKSPADIKKIKEFIENEVSNADGMVIALEMLLYGGLVPSRIHFFEVDEILERLNILKKIKEKNPNFKIYAYNLVMRCPQYNDDDEEPDYYNEYGYRIFRRAYLKDKLEHNIITKEEIDELNKISIPTNYLADYENRRRINLNVTKKVIELVYDKIIDFLVIPQDDSAPYGYTHQDQLELKKTIKNFHIETKVLNYPGADEVGMVLTSRMILENKNIKPLVYIKYPSNTSLNVIPLCEDRYLDVTVRYQLTCANCIIASSVKEADFILYVNSPAYNMIPAYESHNKHSGYIMDRNLIEAVEFINYYIDKVPVGIADLAYANGGDLDLISLLEEKGLSMKLASYASWNITCNSLGTSIAMAICYYLYKDTSSHKSFLAHRYLEDVGYCAIVKQIVRNDYCEKMGYTIADVKDFRGDFSTLCEGLIKEEINKIMPSLKNKYRILDIYMPWKRTYEIGLDVVFEENDE